jgi:hypothetical protein
MDADSLAQIRQIVSGTEERLRNEMQALGPSLRQVFDEKMNEKFEEAERHSGVLFEEMGRRLDLVVEGFEGLRQGQTALRQMVEHESLEMQSLIKLSYRQLQDRVETLEQRVHIIEKNLGLSA